MAKSQPNKKASTPAATPIASSIPRPTGRVHYSMYECVVGINAPAADHTVNPNGESTIDIGDFLQPAVGGVVIVAWYEVIDNLRDVPKFASIRVDPRTPSSDDVSLYLHGLAETAKLRIRIHALWS